MVICNAPHAQGEAPAGCTESTAFTSIVSTVAASASDGTQLTTTMALTASTSAIVDSTNEYAAFLFPVTIPAGAVITGTTAQLYFPAGTNDEPLGTLYFVLGSTGPLSAAASNISNRVPTTSSVTWDNSNLGAPGFFTTPDLSAQLQEVYDLTGSLSSAGIMLVYRGNTGTRDFQVLMQDNGVASRNPQLFITYSVSTTCYAQNFAIAYTSQTWSSASWTANGNNPSPTSYTLQYGTATDFTGTLYSSNTLNLFATVTGLTANTQYYARVRSDPDNFYSATASTRTPAVPGLSGEITLVQATGDRVAGGNLALNLTDVGADRLITFQGGGGDGTAPTDNFGHTFTVVKSQPSGGTEPGWIYYYVTTAAYSGTYTATKAAGGINITASLAEWQRTNGAWAVDLSTGQTGSASTTYATGASATTDAASSLVIGAVITQSGVNSAISGPASWGELFTESNGSVWTAGATHFSTSSVAGVSINAQWTGPSTTYGAVHAVFK